MLKGAASFGIIVVSAAIAVWLVFIQPKEQTMRLGAEGHRLDELRVAKAAAFAEYKTCRDEVGVAYSTQWADACIREAERTTLECRLAVMCVHGTYEEGTERCISRAGADKIDADQLRKTCAEAHPSASDCSLEKDGPSLNQRRDKADAECRAGFEMRLYGLGPGAGSP